MSDYFEDGIENGFFAPPYLFEPEFIDKELRAWPFQCDEVLREVVDANCRANAKLAFGLKNVIFFFKKITYCFTR